MRITPIINALTFVLMALSHLITPSNVSQSAPMTLMIHSQTMSLTSVWMSAMSDSATLGHSIA